MSAVLAGLVLLALAALVGQLMLGIKVPVNTIGEAGVITMRKSDPSGLFYLVAGLLAASVALIFVHPGKSPDA